MMSTETSAPPTITTPERESFAEDIRKQLVQELRTAGFAVDPNTDTLKVFIHYFEVTGRTIVRCSRLVHWSRELDAKQLTDEHRNALMCIQAESLAGEDLNPRYSRLQRKPKFSDGLLLDWGIHHFHLGAREAGKMGLSGGGDEILFAFVTDEALYFIDLLTHDDFATYDLIEIVHKNWPELIRDYHCPDVSDTTKFSSDSRKKLRQAGAMTLVEMSDGTVYCSPGGGVTSTGRSFTALLRAQSFWRRIDEVHAKCKANAGQMVEMIRQKVGKHLTELRLVLSLKESMTKFVATEQQTGIEFLVG